MVGQTVAEISRFLWFLRWQPPPSWLFKNSKFCPYRSAVSSCQISLKSVKRTVAFTGVGTRGDTGDLYPRFWMRRVQTFFRRLPVAASLGSKDPHFPEWGVTYKTVTPPVLTPCGCHFFRFISHARTIVRECCKDDDESQWERRKFDPPASQKPLNRWWPKFVWVTTSVISTTKQNFIQIGLGVSVLLMRDFAPLGTKWLGNFFGSWERLQPRRAHRFWRKIRQTTRFRARPFGSRETEV